MFASFRERAEEAEALTKIYAGGLDDLPAWAVVQACDDFVRGRVPGRKTQAFAPSVPEIHERAVSLREQRWERERAANAPPALPGPMPRSAEEITTERMQRLRAANKAWDVNPPPVYGPLGGRFQTLSTAMSPTPEEA
jgi:hypothetical protein